MGEAGKHIAETEYNWERKIDAIQEVYAEAAQTLK
jgi:hypothetical protein